MSVEQRLRTVRAPDEEDAQRRAWEVASAAADRRASTSRASAPTNRRSARRRPALAIAVTAALLIAAVTPPGSAVADWVGDAVRSVVGDERPPARASGLDELPGGGRVLVLAREQAWIAGEGAHRRLAGSVDSATWSPSGRFAALSRGSELFAVDLRGRRRWSVTAPGFVNEAAWSPDGFRVAYIAGTQVRLVAGDGTGDRRVAFRDPRRPTEAFTALAWRPGPGHVLAFADRRTLFLADTDRRRVLWRTRAPGGPALAFSHDGERLLVVGRRHLRILDAADGRTLQRRRRSRGADLAGATWDRRGRRFAVVRRGPATAELLVGRPRGRTIAMRRIFAAGDLDLAGWSPDNRWLLVHWVENDSWLFLPADGGRPRQLTGVKRRFGGAEVMAHEWCCA
jgi:dipeptidyl aminopeptidase/acylaminoacyl peptidase